VSIRGSNHVSLKLAIGDIAADLVHAKTRRKTQAAAVGGSSSTSTSTSTPRICVHSWFKSRPLAIIRENPCSSVAPKHPWHQNIRGRLSPPTDL
jgi:hypothetical protein